ncbi:enoyl-CoA hydratase/isomerase family protein [Histoplasma ohiense]|nr:enoyl-CoA hydratase/isomerase family protein [Histoplasma ohiense (nom. inval.)]
MVMFSSLPYRNRLKTDRVLTFSRKSSRAFNTVHRILGPNSEGAVITRGSDSKFWCTVCGQYESDRRFLYIFS